MASSEDTAAPQAGEETNCSREHQGEEERLKAIKYCFPQPTTLGSNGGERKKKKVSDGPVVLGCIIFDLEFAVFIWAI